MEPKYDGGLVVASVAIAIFASYVALDLAARLHASRVSNGPRWERVTWELGGATAMGMGIWSMHFIAMLALQLPSPIRYSLALLIASVVPAIGASALALFVVSRPQVSQRAVLVGGLCMGTGIAAMHYTGMAAIVTPGGVHYHSGLWWLSVAIAIAASWAALTLAFVLRTHEGLWIPLRGLAAVVMGVAIAGMHYTGMAAARFPLASTDEVPTPHAGVLASNGLAVAVTGGACAILGLALTGAALSIRARRLEQARSVELDELLRNEEDARRARTEDMLRRAATALAVTGPAFFDAALAELMRMLYANLGLIARIEDGAARTIVLMRRTQRVPDITVPLEGSPFAHVLRGPGMHCIPSGVREQFPQPWVQENGAVGYIGAPIHDPNGELTGLIAIFTPHELHERGEAEALLQIFATRVSGEMQQRSMEAALRQSEHRLFQIEKMEAIGQLAGGVAHDFNNVLTVILGYGEEMLAATPNGETGAQLREMLTAAGRAKQLTHQLLAFSRSQVLEARAVDFDEIVASLQSMLRRVIGEDVKVVTRAGSGGAAVFADPGQLSQVLLNLAVNARDAMPDGGTLSIETDRVDLDHEIAHKGRLIPAGRYVRLVVRDTGIGMDDATLNRIYEPFFSTKGSRGTGLGLATVYGIVRQSGGFIGCDSVVGVGTAFTIYFPVTTQRPVSLAPAEAPAPERRGQESVLVVEDEEAVRQFLSTALKRRGYTPRTASSAAEALELLRGGLKPDVLLTDFVLPGGMNGAVLAAAAADVQPGLRTILMSGYAKEPMPAQDTVPAHAFIQKPFTPDALSTKIREVLGK
jgi:NO-binding membrane sensor protein with MHYT domain/nitrogen-specific signal transduction histidine kinase